MSKKTGKKYTYPLLVILGAVLMFLGITAIYSQVYPYLLLNKNIKAIQNGTDYNLYSSLYDFERGFDIYGTNYSDGRNEATIISEYENKENPFSCQIAYNPENGVEIYDVTDENRLSEYADFFELISKVNPSDVHFRNISKFWSYRRWYFVFEYEYEGYTGILGISRRHPESMLIEPDEKEYGTDIYASIGIILYSDDKY